MKTIYLFCFMSLFISSMLHASEADPGQSTNHNCADIVNTEDGPVSGIDSARETTVCAYLGIPYASPPIDELRWRAPQPPEKRIQLLQAEQFGPDCMQARWLSDATIKTAATETSEDCLYLNIWRPKKAGKYPVMVWIHGGGLLIGSAAWPIYDGSSLASKDVVLVSINYRLGAFGYLAHPALVDKSDGNNGGSAGNYGLLDQLQALEWVRKNIHHFEGDPSNVTIFGESAGAWSVLTLLTLPDSEGLFHRAIAQSGGSKTAHKSDDAFRIGKRFAKQLGCEKTENQANCLRKAATADDIVSASLRANTRCMLSMKVDTGFCFIPRIDGTLLPDLPYTLIQQNREMNIPIIAGYTSKDPWFLRNSTIDSTIALQDNPSWLYQFKFKKHALNILTSGIHGTDLPVVFDTMTDFRVFHNKYPFYKEKHARKAENLVNTIQGYWINFARHGDPNGTEIEESLPKWPQYGNQHYMYFSNTSELKQNRP